MSPLTIRRGTTAECIPIRWAVLRKGMPESTAHLPGDDERETFHVVAERQRAIVGCATFIVRPFPPDSSERRGWQLRGMAVDPATQGSGIGSVILAKALEILGAEILPRRDASGATLPPETILWCKARIAAASFYRRNGWVSIGEEFDIPPFGRHFLMRWQPAPVNA